jgi:carboxymethylenebutenolidase
MRCSKVGRDRRARRQPKIDILFRMKRAVVVLAVVFIAQSIHAQEWAKPRLNNSPRHGEWVDIKSGDRTIKAFVVYPERKDKAPVVLVIHEIFGLTDWVRGVCDQLAENGVIAIAPDLLSGQTFADGDGARKAIAALPKEQIEADLNAASDYALTKIPAANGTLTVCGFCWGGGWTFEYASVNPKLKAAYSFYGVALTDPAEWRKRDSGWATPQIEANRMIANIACPVYGFYAENDERVNATIPKAQELMRAAGKKYAPVIYKGAGHGFMREGEMPNASDANKKAHNDAWARWKTLLKQL